MADQPLENSTTPHPNENAESQAPVQKRRSFIVFWILGTIIGAFGIFRKISLALKAKANQADEEVYPLAGDVCYVVEAEKEIVESNDKENAQ